MGRIVLKVDIDTKVGLIEGVPTLMRILGRRNIKASFFIAMGPDNSGRALKRLLKPKFLRKQIKARAASSYGVKTMLYGVLLPGPIIARQAPELFSRLMAASHEVGIHGWDHVYWHDKVRFLPPDLVRAQLAQAVRLFKDIVGMPPAALAAPGWQVSNEAWRIMADLGITHTSCTRGYGPFLPRMEGGRTLPLLEIPTTMPSLDEALGQVASLEEALPWLCGHIKRDALNVFTLHGEVEGRNFAVFFEKFLDRLMAMNMDFITLGQAALQSVPGAASGAFKWGEIRGRAGELALQV